MTPFLPFSFVLASAKTSTWCARATNWKAYPRPHNIIGTASPAPHNIIPFLRYQKKLSTWLPNSTTLPRLLRVSRDIFLKYKRGCFARDLMKTRGFVAVICGSAHPVSTLADGVKNVHTCRYVVYGTSYDRRKHYDDETTSLFRVDLLRCESSTMPLFDIQLSSHSYYTPHFRPFDR